MDRYAIKGKWKSRIPELLAAKGEMLGLGRPVKPDEMAAEIGVSRQTVYNWASLDGIDTLTGDSSAKLVQYFGVPVWNIWRLEFEPADKASEVGQPVGVAAV